jgi:hypothetical protein
MVHGEGEFERHAICGFHGLASRMRDSDDDDCRFWVSYLPLFLFSFFLLKKKTCYFLFSFIIYYIIKIKKIPIINYYFVISYVSSTKYSYYIYIYIYI